MRSLTTQVKALAQLLQDLAQANVRGALWPSLKKFVSSYGYSQLSVLQGIPAPSEPGTHVLFSDADAEALDRFQRTAGRNPVVLHALSATEAFARSEISTLGIKMDPGFDAQCIYCGGEGLIVPVTNDGVRGVAVLAGEAPDLSPVARSIVHVAAETAFRRAQTLPEGEAPPASPVLSPREAVILSWAAAGKADAEIGLLLKISARTVRFHTDNAKRKLQVTTRIQAVTKAARLGLIKL